MYIKELTSWNKI